MTVQMMQRVIPMICLFCGTLLIRENMYTFLYIHDLLPYYSPKFDNKQNHM